MNDNFEEPFKLNSVDEFAISLDEILQSYLRADFTREEAFELAKVHLASCLGNYVVIR